MLSSVHNEILSDWRDDLRRTDGFRGSQRGTLPVCVGCGIRFSRVSAPGRKNKRCPACLADLYGRYASLWVGAE